METFWKWYVTAAIVLPIVFSIIGAEPSVAWTPSLVATLFATMGVIIAGKNLAFGKSVSVAMRVGAAISTAIVFFLLIFGVPFGSVPEIIVLLVLYAILPPLAGISVRLWAGKTRYAMLSGFVGGSIGPSIMVLLAWYSVILHHFR